MTVDPDLALAAFEDRFPALARRLAALTEDLLEPIYEDGELVDVSLSGKRFYGRSGKKLARAQMDAYLDAPYRTVIENPGSVGLSSPLAVEVGTQLVRYLEGEKEPRFSVFPRRGRTFLFVYGVGLGHELERLVEGTEAAFILFVEPIPEILKQSLKVVDWAALFDRMDEKGIAYDFVLVDQPESIHVAVQTFVYKHGPGFLDGAYVFQHYSLWSLTEAKRLFREGAHQLFLAVGYFEDEEVMMRNTVGNFLRGDGGLLDGAPRLERREPVFIVGSGPSLDGSIETIRRLRDKALIVSGGTALSILLRHGITPDYHVELENGEWVFEIISRIAAEHDLSQVRFLGSTSVDPRVGDLFGQANFFLRDAISSTRVFRGPLRQVDLCAPTCVNAALTCFALLGFKQFHLFGVDCGKRTQGRAHAEGSVYERKELGLDENRHKYETVLRGNFGGQVVTNWVYELSRTMLARTIQHRSIEVFNCSDGALIGGSIARLPESVNLPNGALDRDRLRSELERRFLPLDGLARIRAADLDAVMDDARDLRRMVENILDAAGESDDPFSEVYARIHTRSWDGASWTEVPDTIMGGTVRAAARMAMYFGIRVAEDGRHRSLYALYVEAFRRILEEMEGRLQLIVDEAKSGIPDSLPRAEIQ